MWLLCVYIYMGKLHLITSCTESKPSAVGHPDAHPHHSYHTGCFISNPTSDLRPNVRFLSSMSFIYPICSMYGIFTYKTGSFMGQMLVNIPYMEHMGMGDIAFFFLQTIKIIENSPCCAWYASCLGRILDKHTVS